MDKIYSILGMMFVTVLLTANVIGEKPVALFGLILPAGLLLFPLTYLLGVVLSELYGFKASRVVIWLGLICNIFMALAIKTVLVLPAKTAWPHHEAYATILGFSSRLMLISVATYFVGECVNAYVVHTLRKKLSGRWFILRGLLGNWLGEGIETTLFIPLAFYPVLTKNEILETILIFYLFKISYAMLLMPGAKGLVLLLSKYKKQQAVFA